MDASSLIICDCCKAEIPDVLSSPDEDLSAPVCEDCRKKLMMAKAIMAMSHSAPANGMPVMMINLRGCYKGENAPDNF